MYARFFFCLTPKRHENSVEDGSRVVEEVRDLLVEADVRQLPLVTLLAERAHVELVALLAGLDGDGVGVHGEHPVEEHEHAHHGSREKPARVEACEEGTKPVISTFVLNGNNLGLIECPNDYVVLF